MPLTIHHLQVSQSERIPWLCEELGIPYELKIYQRSPLLCPPELASLTPMRSAPVMEDTASSTAPGTAEVTPAQHIIMSESGAITEYIIHRHGEGRLALPPTHPRYANYLYWFHFANGSLQPALMRYSTARSLTAALPPDSKGSVLAELSAKNVHKALANMDAHLADPANPWLAGDEFTAADVMNVWCLTTMRVFCPIGLEAYPGILAYLARVGERPAYKRAMAKADPDMVPHLGGAAPELFPALRYVLGSTPAAK